MFIRILIVVVIVAGFAGFIHWYDYNSRPNGRGVFLGELGLTKEQSRQVDDLLVPTQEEAPEVSNWIQ